MILKSSEKREGYQEKRGQGTGEAQRKGHGTEGVQVIERNAEAEQTLKLEKGRRSSRGKETTQMINMIGGVEGVVQGTNKVQSEESEGGPEMMTVQEENIEF